MTPRLNIVLLVLILLVGVPYYWLFLDNSPRDVPARPLTMAQLRSAAAAEPASRPVSISMERVVKSTRKSNWLAADSGIVERPYALVSFLLQFRDRRPVVVDTGPDRRMTGSPILAGFIEKRQRVVDQTLREASAIVFTGSHIEQVGGLLALDDPQIASRTLFSPAQLARASTETFTRPLARIVGSARLSGTGVERIAPGVAAIATGTPDAGSQMIYVQLANGREYLLAGQTAPVESSWKYLMGRPRIRTDRLLPESRTLAMSWLQTIRKLRVEAPALVIVPGNDYETIMMPEARSGIAGRFPAPSPHDMSLENAGRVR